MLSPLLAPLQAFAGRLTAAYGPGSLPGAQPEAQLTGPVEDLLRHYPAVDVRREVAMTGVGRPDLGVLVSGLLTGYVELKPPGKGANPTRFRDPHDKKQWEKFKSLPNVLYTDGQEWALYRDGERQGPLCRLASDVTADGSAAATEASAVALDRLLRDFLSWQPVVPSQPKALAEVLAPLCRLLRDDVAEGLLADPASPLGSLLADWQVYFFPDATAEQFADAYAQTLTYALLLAQVSGATALDPATAAAALRAGHGLLSDTLRVLAQPEAYDQVRVPLDLLRRTVAEVNPVLFGSTAADPWLYFYEDFLGAYDPAMRKQRGVYYTPVEVVQAQVRLVDDLLRTRLGAAKGFVDPLVATLDPACGTGTYLLAALRYGLDHVAATYGAGVRAQFATTAAQQMYAFELLVGPYAVAHLRLTQQVVAAGGTLPAGGINVLLADTLDSPHATPPDHLPLAYRALSQEHIRAQHVKANVPILVCIGNPPYYREQHEAGAAVLARERHGGWVRFGSPGAADAVNRPLLQDFLEPLAAVGAGIHAKNLYNDYVYFWRWALWKVFEQPPHHTGIVSFITASSYLRGPGFAGMRQVMRETFEELWIINLEGDNLGARKTANVFAIQTPVCIAIGIRTGSKVAGQPAAVRYCRLTGSEADKLARLGGIESFADLTWQDCPTAWTAPLLPAATTAYVDWPLLTDVFPWQTSGMQFKRSWPIGENAGVLQARWARLVGSPAGQRGELFKESRDRRITSAYTDLINPAQTLTPIARLTATEPVPGIQPISYRSFDRQWALVDSRVGDYLRPSLQQAHGPQQVYLTSLLTGIVGEGPAAVASELPPDLHHFRGSFGGADVIPLYRDAAGTQPNLPAGLLALLSSTYNPSTPQPLNPSTPQPLNPSTPQPLNPSAGARMDAYDVLAYAYALLATPHYVELFWEELETPGPRLPLTADAALFEEVAALGRTLLRLHTWGHRFGPAGAAATVPPGAARIGTGTTAYPEKFGYDEAAHTIIVGEGLAAGRFTDVAPAVWNYAVSGLQVVDSWLGYRMLKRSGKSSSPLDALRPAAWAFDVELLELLWTLEATLAVLPAAAALLDRVVTGPLLLADALPVPTAAEREGPARPAATGGLFG